jgi:hypothetical protein
VLLYLRNNGILSDIVQHNVQIVHKYLIYIQSITIPISLFLYLLSVMLLLSYICEENFPYVRVFKSQQTGFVKGMYMQPSIMSIIINIDLYFFGGNILHTIYLYLHSTFLQQNIRGYITRYRF